MWSLVTTKEVAMKRIGVREFRDHATKYLAGDEPLAIERHGEPIGFYFPVTMERRDPDAEAARRQRLQESIATLEETIKEVLDRTGMTEDELADLFDPNKPLPEQPIRRPRRVAVSDHASGD
jgi:hypothetical protein